MANEESAEALFNQVKYMLDDERHRAEKIADRRKLYVSVVTVLFGFLAYNIGWVITATILAKLVWGIVLVLLAICTYLLLTEGDSAPQCEVCEGEDGEPIMVCDTVTDWVENGLNKVDRPGDFLPGALSGLYPSDAIINSECPKGCFWIDRIAMHRDAYLDLVIRNRRVSLRIKKGVALFILSGTLLFGGAILYIALPGWVVKQGSSTHVTDDEQQEGSQASHCQEGDF
ncbi:MAG: hypothetical protein Phyf2KO_00700 [Phycisphaerales bacterium]